jgi:hypothetical protein
MAKGWHKDGWPMDGLQWYLDQGRDHAPTVGGAHAVGGALGQR